MIKWFLSLPIIARVIIVALGAIALFVILYKLYTWYVRQKNEIILQNAQANTSVNGFPVNVNLGSVAQRIHDAFHNYWWGMSEDEDTAITALNDVPKQLIPQLSAIYFNVYSANLNGEFVKYLSPSDYAKVANQFS